MERVARKKLETLAWILRGLLVVFGLVALLTLLGVLGFLAIGAIIFNPFILVVLGIAIIVIAAM
ncbi:MAG TPA: hypothetical protein VF172_11820, partial [Nitrososphaera sp.]